MATKPACVGLLLLAGFAAAQDDDFPKQRAAIRQAAQAYLAAVNRGDAEAIASFWTQDGDVIDAAGRTSKGRDSARRAVPREKAEAARLSVNQDSLRFISAEVAIEDGTAEVLSEEGDDASLGRYSAIWVLREGKWLLDSVREGPLARQTHHDWVRSLAWMIGDWQEDEPEPRVEMSCSWSKDKNYLLREVQVHAPDGEQRTMSQRIGWDAGKQQLRVWTFGADGGFGEAICTRRGNRWIVAAVGTTHDGEAASNTIVYTRLDDKTMLWESSEAVVGDHSLPDMKVRLVRKAAKAERK